MPACGRSRLLRARRGEAVDADKTYQRTLPWAAWGAGSPSTTVGKQVVLPVRSLMSSSPRCHTAVPRCHRCHRVQL